MARVRYNHLISNKGEWNNCFSKFSNRVLPPIFISTILQSVRKENLAHYFPYDVKLRLLAHSRSFLANQKARNAIVGAENLLIFDGSCSRVSVFLTWTRQVITKAGVMRGHAIPSLTKSIAASGNEMTKQKELCDVISFPDLLWTKPKARSGKVRKFVSLDWLLHLTPVQSPLWKLTRFSAANFLQVLTWKFPLLLKMKSRWEKTRGGKIWK